MSSTGTKKNRMLEIFFRAMRGESISVKVLADEYGVSPKSISRDVSEIKNFLCENRELVDNSDFKYSPTSKSYSLELKNFLLSKELNAIIKMMIGCRAFSRGEILNIINKLQTFTTQSDRQVLKQVIKKELYHYNGVKSDCDSVINHLWLLTRCIYEHSEITVSYYKISRERVSRRLRPVAIMYSDFYFYLIAYRCDDANWEPLYYRVDRIVDITEHREHFELSKEHDFDEGELRNKIQFMFPGISRNIRIEYTGESVQAILDNIPTARIIGQNGKTYVIEADTYGVGVNMFLLSQGSRVRAIYPPEFVEEMKQEVENMMSLYK